MTRLARMTDECVRELGCGPKAVRGLYSGPTAHWLQPVTYSERTLDVSDGALSEIVLEKATAALRQAHRDLTRRGADFDLGLSVKGVRDISGEPGFAQGMDRYMVVLCWNGPKPTWWPYEVTDQTAKPTSDEDTMSDAEFKRKFGASPESLLEKTRKKKAAKKKQGQS